jgi:hypothetical protein
MTSMILRSARHHLFDIDYESRIVGGLLRDFDHARVATKPLEPHHLVHPHLREILAAVRAIEAEGQTPTTPIIHERLIARQARSAVPFIADAVGSYIASADGPRLRLFVGRILALGRLRWLLGLADRVDLILGDRCLDGSSRIEAAYKAIREAFEEIGVETERLDA